MLDLLPVGNVDEQLLQKLAPMLADTLRVPCRIRRRENGLDPKFAFHPERGQYHSSEILQAMQGHVKGAWRVLGVTGVDLYIPILTFVFGEAQMGGPCSVVSYQRLRQEFYGLPADEDLLLNRLAKEAVHEVGHTLDLTHCRDYSCAMAPSHAVEWIDLKESALCGNCAARVMEVVE